jgi:hypothetical protein
VCVVVGRRVIARARVTSDAVHAGGTGEVHAGGPPGCLPRKLNILGTALTRVVAPRPVYGDAPASFRNTGADK